jgi:hypothetical protein
MNTQQYTATSAVAKERWEEVDGSEALSNAFDLDRDFIDCDNGIAVLCPFCQYGGSTHIHVVSRDADSIEFDSEDCKHRWKLVFEESKGQTFAYIGSLPDRP